MSLYFAYGSNLDETQMKNRCPNATKLNFNWIIKDYQPFFPMISAKRQYAGVMGIKKQIGEYVEGILYDIPENEIKILDQFERCPAEGTNGYNKINLLCWNATRQNEVSECFIYYPATEPTINYRPSFGYYSTILKGMLAAGFDQEYIYKFTKIAIEGIKPSFYQKLTSWISWFGKHNPALVSPEFPNY
jgi:hypothetical protein